MYTALAPDSTGPTNHVILTHAINLQREIDKVQELFKVEVAIIIVPKAAEWCSEWCIRKPRVFAITAFQIV